MAPVTRPPQGGFYLGERIWGYLYIREIELHLSTKSRPTEAGLPFIQIPIAYEQRQHMTLTSKTALQ
jgi:hypothetical protein